jgi:hypothetical protein
MKQLGWTTLEQSKRLIEAGLDPNTADMAILKDNTYCNALSAFNGATLCQNYNEIKNKTNYIPCWSLGALLNVMDSPKIFYRIECTCGETEVHVSGSGFHKYFDNIIDTILWLLENGYIEKV